MIRFRTLGAGEFGDLEIWIGKRGLVGDLISWGEKGESREKGINWGDGENPAGLQTTPAELSYKSGAGEALFKWGG